MAIQLSQPYIKMSIFIPTFWDAPCYILISICGPEENLLFCFVDLSVYVPRPDFS